MDHSLSQSVAVACSACKQEFGADVWVIIDQTAQPDLIQQLEDQQLNTLVCPHCQRSLGPADEPLLLYCPTQEPQLIFSPAEKTHLKEDQAHEMHHLVQTLLKSLKSDDTEWVVENLKRVPRSELLALLQDSE